MERGINIEMRAAALGSTIAAHTSKEGSAPDSVMEELVGILAHNPDALKTFVNLQRDTDGNEVVLIDNSQK